jgi:hypothetical protein
VREGRAPLAEREISSQLPTRKEATWSRKKNGSGVMKKSQRAQSEHLQGSLL